MPEGDVVWRTARRLDAALSGRLLTSCDLRWPSLATVDLTGRSVLEVVSAGKHILCRVGPSADGPEAVTLRSHLRMEGSWQIQRAGGGRRVGSGHGVRAVLGNDGWTALGRRLGMLDLVPTGQEHTLVGHLGPDLLGPDWDAGEAIRRIGAAPHRAIGEALLDQRTLAGVGTFYMSEALFLRGITPWTAVEAIPEAGVSALVDLLHRLLLVNRDRAVQITTGDGRPGRSAYVHARSGRPCLRCGRTVRVAPIGAAPADRTAFYCPVCQFGPTPTDGGGEQGPLGATRRHPGRG